MIGHSSTSGSVLKLVVLLLFKGKGAVNIRTTFYYNNFLSLASLYN